MNRLKDKVAIVTGASRGIGAGIAIALAADGARVVLNYAASSSGADRVVADIRAAGGDISSNVTRIFPAESAICTGTRGAVDAITGVLAQEPGPRGIRVNAVNRGLIETDGAHAAG